MTLEQPNFVDMNIVCQRCNDVFEWTAGEQLFYDERGLAQPKYCKPCRKARKQEYQNRA